MRLLRFILILLSVVVIPASILSYASMYISTEKVWFLVFFGLAYLPILIVHLTLLVLWLFVKKRMALVMLLILLPGLQAHQSSFAFGEGEEVTDSSQVIQVLTYNVKGFDFTSKEPHREEIITAIAESKADIICLQEFNSYHNQKGKPDNLQELQDKTGLKYKYYQRCYQNRKGSRSFGVLILSRFPIVDKGHLEFETVSKMNTTIYTDLNIGGDTIRMYTTHLQSNQLTHSDFDFINQTQEHDTLQFDTKRVASKLKSSAQIRAAQVLNIRESIEASPYPVLFTGDFNDTPVSFAYATISEDLGDAFLSASKGTGATYIPFPFIRIDYLLYDPEAFSTVSYKKQKSQGSDHYMVEVELLIK
jgi:endonuclease/exonuclease/phosphatase family metal-dependent hydrolase